MAAAARWDLSPATVCLWVHLLHGGIYGSLGQVAFNARLSPVAWWPREPRHGRWSWVGALIVSDATALTPRDTLWPQVLVTGATVGSLVSGPRSRSP